MSTWPIVCFGLFLIVSQINPKTRLLRVIVEQIKIYKNDRTGKYYFPDFLSFIITPMGIALIVASNLPLSTIVNHAETIVTVFSLLTTLPLSFLALFIDKLLQSQKEKEIAKETFVSITLDIIYFMLVIAIIIVSAFINVSAMTERMIVAIISFFVIKIALNILMILKRVFSIWDNQ